MQRWLRRSLWDVVPRDQRDSPEVLRRRQVITVLTVLLGAVLLGVSLRIEPGSDWFYVGTLALAAVWTVGAFASGPLHLGRIARLRGEGMVRPVVAPVVIGLGLAGVFVLGALVVREIPWLEDQVRSVTDFADRGALPVLVVVTAVNGAAEELFFRGAAYAAVPRHPVLWTTVAYVIATAATGNVMLAFAAILLGTLVGLQRRASGGILAPVLTHVSWGLAMLLVLPLLFG
ncbi:CPBP family intramembrane metalloprotease [Nocardioides sp. zg-536]|uniref:CPBP family intramembrane metalloprotease n=1 Tax=Nocardioides faecalis TaxID=2803858 RepID=A0A938Y375_9ACTN|nr:CPBP family intramembrane glutamic endopeptidase [Nocardioides faecalis]MBM9458302.1 CPBP family intramembrane metalloprotease [Nocardioides faecalis]MBS4753397.1 CPBP family intramembrane metalloprotease [Nocardioides faecalis]QVI58330.1 CPBP family intramembrane metalloprotease [Nocardioides faecalis]